MKKHTLLVIILILIAALLFAVFYKDLKLFWLPAGSPAERPIR